MQCNAMQCNANVRCAMKFCADDDPTQLLVSGCMAKGCLRGGGLGCSRNPGAQSASFGRNNGDVRDVDKQAD